MERDDVYNLQYKEIKVAKAKRTYILTQLYLYREISIRKVATELKLKEAIVKQFIQFLIQDLILRGHYKKGTFIVSNFYKYPIISKKKLTELQIIILGILIPLPKVKVSELANICIISKEQIKDNLMDLVKYGYFAGYISKGYINSIKIEQLDKKEKISDEDIFIIGTCMMRRKAILIEVAKDTGIKREKVLYNIAKLLLNGKLEAKIQLETGFLSSEVIVTVSKFMISPRKISLSDLDEEEKDTVGYLLLRKKATIKSISKYVEKDSINILRILAELTAKGTFQVTFTDKVSVTPLVELDLRPVRTIEEMATLSFFNYEALFGLLSTKNTIAIKKLANSMSRSEDEITEAVINLMLDGFVDCTLKGNRLQINKVNRYSRAQEGTLERWEKIVLGMVISKTIISVKDISVALGIDKNFAVEKLYGFYGKGLIKGSIVGNRLIPDEIPLFPPLSQLEDFESHFIEIFGYIISNDSINLKMIQKLWNKSITAVKNILYELVGSALIVLEIKRNSAFIISSQSFMPNKELEDLGKIYVRLVNEIEKSRRKRVKISNLANSLSMEKEDLFKLLCQLTAFGYYKGRLTTSYFERIGKLIEPAKKAKCLNCGYILKSPYNPCSNCRQMPSLCTVCQGLIKSGDEVYECPSCTNLAHREHLLKWISIKSECPLCKSRISQRTLKKVTL